MIVFLNGLTTFRYTAVFRFENQLLKTVCFYDREDLKADALPEIPIAASYSVARDSRSVVSLPDSLAKALLAAHPECTRIRAYCGAPLLDPCGDVVGSLCHFDFEPIPFMDTHAALLEQAAELIMRYDLASAR